MERIWHADHANLASNLWLISKRWPNISKTFQTSLLLIPRCRPTVSVGCALAESALAQVVFVRDKAIERSAASLCHLHMWENERETPRMRSDRSRCETLNARRKSFQSQHVGNSIFRFQTGKAFEDGSHLNRKLFLLRGCDRCVKHDIGLGPIEG